MRRSTVPQPLFGLQVGANVCDRNLFACLYSLSKVLYFVYRSTCLLSLLISFFLWQCGSLCNVNRGPLLSPLPSQGHWYADVVSRCLETCRILCSSHTVYSNTGTGVIYFSWQLPCHQSQYDVRCRPRSLLIAMSLHPWTGRGLTVNQFYSETACLFIYPFLW